MTRYLIPIFLTLLLGATEFVPPAGERYAGIGSKGSILPGGRIIQPLGVQLETGPSPLGLALSSKGVVATADNGPERFGITLYERAKDEWRGRHIWARTPNSKEPQAAEPDWKGISTGIAFETERSIWASEGSSGRVRLIDLNSGNHQKIVSLNGAEWQNSFTSELVNDTGRRLLFAIDRANSRVVAIDTKKGLVVSSLRLEGEPCAIALGADASVYVATRGEKNGVVSVDSSDPAKPGVRWRVGLRAAPSGLAVGGDKVFVSSASNDSVAVIATGTHLMVADLDLRIPHLEEFRGIEPEGLAYDAVNGWVLVAEAGIDAMGVIDAHGNKLIGHVAVGWRPMRLAIAGDRVYVANARGRGTGPNVGRPLSIFGDAFFLHSGSLSTFVMPVASEMPKLTGTVYTANGFMETRSLAVAARKDFPKIKHVVVIVKSATAPHSFDQVMGDVAGMGELARFGMHGVADGGKVRFSVKDAAVSPNQHALAEHWAFSDNYYSDDDEAPDGESLARRAAAAGVTFGTSVLGASFPQLLYIQMAGDKAEYPHEAAAEADSDLEVGRIVAALSKRREWRETVVFVVGNGTGNGVDHIDSHREVLLAAGPYVKRGFVSHTNASWPGLVKTVGGILHFPAVNLREATAADLSNIFTDEADFGGYEAVLPDKRVFDPENQ